MWVDKICCWELFFITCPSICSTVLHPSRLPEACIHTYYPWKYDIICEDILSMWLFLEYTLKYFYFIDANLMMILISIQIPYNYIGLQVRNFFIFSASHLLTWILFLSLPALFPQSELLHLSFTVKYLRSILQGYVLNKAAHSPTHPPNLFSLSPEATGLHVCHCA